ncbi:MAG: NlpC/P60 family protein [Candidatus Gracilibacteria bacterium]|nr:NlpC/P60 family protein [Candidatus Gracilibacteria bacterium]
MLEQIQEKLGLKEKKENPSSKAKIETTSLGVDILNSDISAGQLFEAEAKGPNIMNKFAKKIDDKTYNIDFGTNKSLENNIGLSEVMPEEVKKVHIIGEKNGRKYDLVGTRQGTKGGFYDENGRYLAIFNGFKVEVLESYTSEELASKQKENDEKISSLSADSKFDDFRTKFGEKELSSIIKKGVEYSIDPMFLISLRKIENGGSGREFGVMNPSMDTFDGQLNMACRIIQDNMNKYKRVTGENPIASADTFSGEFVAYLSNIYAPIGASDDPNNLNKNHFTNLISSYSKYTGYDFGNTDILLAKATESRTKWQTAFDADSLEGKTSPDELIASLSKNVGKKYVLGGDGVNGIDCSQLIIEGLKDKGVVNQQFDTTAENLARFTSQKDPSQVKKGDFVFLSTMEGHITHVEMATGPIEGNKIPIIDASTNAGAVTYREQTLNQKVVVGTPIFYS